MMRVTKDGKRKYVSLGVSVYPNFWDFEKNKPKRNCPNRELINQLILNHTKAYREQALEYKAENKDFTSKSLIDKVNKTRNYKIHIDTNIIDMDKVNTFEKISNSPFFTLIPDETEIDYKIMDWKDEDLIKYMNFSKVIAYMKMKYDTIPILSNSGGIEIYEKSPVFRNATP